MRAQVLIVMAVAAMLAGHLAAGVAGAQTTLPTPTAPVAAGQATLLLRSGIRVAGEFEDIQNDEVQLRLSAAVERRIPVGGVLVVDFGGAARNLAATEAALAVGHGHVLVLEDGTIWTGTLEDVHRIGEGGARTTAAAPVEILFRHGAVTTRVALDEITRLYLGEVDLADYEDTVAPPAAPTEPPLLPGLPVLPEPLVLPRPPVPLRPPRTRVP